MSPHFTRNTMLERTVLTDAETGMGVAEWETEGDDYAVSLRTLHGGKQEGSQLLRVHTDDLDVVLIPTRGLGIHSVTAGDVQLGWESPIKEVVHPAFMHLESRGGLGWLEGFNEWLCRCGLEWSGHPGEDRFINNVGDEATMQVTLHGKIANIPVSTLAVTVGEDGILVEAQTHERMFHGPKLVLHSRVHILRRGTALRIEDIVENRSSRPQEFQMLYHCNVGRPLLGAGARVVVEPELIEPFNERAAEGLATYDQYDAPVSGFVEQVYCVHPKADDTGTTRVMLHNAAADQGVALSYKREQLPCFTLWKNTAALEDGYVTGIEPGTSFPRTRRIEREAGRVPVLAPGATQSFGITVDVLTSMQQVLDMRNRIRS